ncbi:MULTISPECIES: patatin-like phospholipase family protein [unclassified Legionella]|uniref:patatin-like phospholipase family protein n=1 Tax=unclassified Legionella TaxID=2622702 RepID=UPI001E463C68|nr:patatin-like phospholipase family protein [Legionella sp. 31fI33]MCC5015236.1 patatin-like phospholipase family protein [Legionella sp. 31fI33]
MTTNPKTINLALQGGGAYGALAWGVLDKFLEDGRINFGSISASSVGALNAAALVYGLIEGGNDEARETLYKLWKMISNAGQLYNPIKITPIEELFAIDLEHSLSFTAFDLMSKMFSPYQLNPFNFNPLREILKTILNIDQIKIAHTPKLFITATNVKTGKVKLFNNEHLSIDAIMASTCVPFMFQAVQIDDDYFWDGGYIGSPALSPLLSHSPNNDILILHTNPIAREQVPESATDILNRVNEISFNSSLIREIKDLVFVNELLDKDCIKEKYKKNMKQVYLHSLQADKVMQAYPVANKLYFDWTFLCQLFEEGRREAADWLEKNLRYLGKRSTINLNEYF